MKFAALVLLLVVGSQAASLQADAPDQGAEFRGKVKETLDRIGASLDATSYKDSKDRAIKMGVERLGQAYDMGHSAFQTAVDSTADGREAFMKEYESFVAEISGDIKQFKDTIESHIAEYRTELAPVKEHLQGPGVEDLKTKVISAKDSIIALVPENWQETKAALLAIVEKAKTRFAPYVEQAKQQVEPYMAEASENLKKYLEDPANQGAPAFADLKAKLAQYLPNMA